MAVWLWNGTEIAQVANGGRYAVTGLYDDAWPTLAGEPPRLLMRVGRPDVVLWPDVRTVGLGVIVWGEDAPTAEGRLLALRGLFSPPRPGTLGHRLFSGQTLTMQARLTRFETETLAPMVYRVALEFQSVDDPYFRDTAQVVTQSPVYNGGDPIAFTHHNPGVEDRGAVIRFHGPATNPILFNYSASPSGEVWVGYSGTISSSAYVELRCAKFEAVDQNGTAINSALITHSGDRYWFPLVGGDNALTYGDDQGGGGWVEIIQNPPY